MKRRKRATELINSHKELAFIEIKKSVLLNNHSYQELVFQNEGKEKRAAELIIANKELVFQNKKKKSVLLN